MSVSQEDVSIEEGLGDVDAEDAAPGRGLWGGRWQDPRQMSRSPRGEVHRRADSGLAYCRQGSWPRGSQKREEEGCGVPGGGSPGHLGLPAVLGRKGQLVEEGSAGKVGVAGLLLTGSASSVAEGRVRPRPPWDRPGAGGEDGATGGRNRDPRPLHTLAWEVGGSLFPKQPVVSIFRRLLFSNV